MTRSTGTSPDIPIHFEDNHLLVVEKPVNLLSQADHTGDPDLLTLCKGWLIKEYDKPGKAFLGLVHRLDRPVGGVMVLAKTSRAASRLSKEIRERTFQKRYMAVVRGKTAPNGVLIHYLQKDPATNRVKVTRNSRKSLRAELSYIRKGYDPASDLSLLIVNLHTGRPHQIRVQFSADRHPLVGDTKYGGEKEEAGTPALFASRLRFLHPVSAEKVTFSAAPPSTFPWSLFPA